MFIITGQEKGPSMSNATPYRAGRGRVYSGGAMVYFKENYGVKDKTTLQEKSNKRFRFIPLCIRLRFREWQAGNKL